MSQQSLFIFQYHRRGQTSLWDMGDGRLQRIEPSEYRQDRRVRFEKLSDRQVQVSVHEPEAFDPLSSTLDGNDVASLADQAFRTNLPDQLLAEAH